MNAGDRDSFANALAQIDAMLDRDLAAAGLAASAAAEPWLDGRPAPVSPQAPSMAPPDPAPRSSPVPPSATAEPKEPPQDLSGDAATGAPDAGARPARPPERSNDVPSPSPGRVPAGTPAPSVRVLAARLAALPSSHVATFVGAALMAFGAAFAIVRSNDPPVVANATQPSAPEAHPSAPSPQDAQALAIQGGPVGAPAGLGAAKALPAAPGRGEVPSPGLPAPLAGTQPPQAPMPSDAPAAQLSAPAGAPPPGCASGHAALGLCDVTAPNGD